MSIRNFKVRDNTDFILIHSTGHDDDIGAFELRRQHLAKGWLDIGYHYVIRRDGRVEDGRIYYAPAGFEPKQSVAICMVASEEITSAQAASLRSLITNLIDEYPEASIYPKCQFTNFNLGELVNYERNDRTDHAPCESHPSEQTGSTSD